MGVALYKGAVIQPGWTTIAIPHGLGEEPQYISATPYCKSKYRLSFVVGRDETNITISVYNWEDSSVSAGFWAQARL